MSTYLVTGAAGFIAFKVIDLLLEEGNTVVGMDNLNSAYDPRLKRWRLDQLKTRKNFIFYHQDICNRKALDEIARKYNSFQAVINLAARAGVRYSVEDPWAFLDSNVTGTLNLLEFCRNNKIGKFILASTSSIYGLNPHLPTPEEADSSRPLQPYAASKKAAEVLAHSYHHLYSLDITVFRYFTVYGPAGRPDLALFRFVQWISEGRPVQVSGDGSQSRGFTYLDDIARGTLLGLKPMGYEIINLGGHQTVTVNELISRVENLTGKKAQIEYIPMHCADMHASWADTTKARKLLGWDPLVTLEEGIPALVDWYRQERSWASQIITA
jgi:UDP-glucuronate 4-epimerase